MQLINPLKMWRIQILGKDTNNSKSHAQSKYREECTGAYLLAFGPEDFISRFLIKVYNNIYCLLHCIGIKIGLSCQGNNISRVCSGMECMEEVRGSWRKLREEGLRGF